MINAIVFDMDGTLIDTEKYYRICWPKALAVFGYHMTDEQALSFRSLGRPFAPARLKELFGDEIDYISVREKRKEIMNEYLENNGIEIKPGAIELLSWLREHGIKTGVATATDFQRTEKYLSELGLVEYIDEIVCATMVKEGKPSPDIYTYVCEQIGEKPENVIAVEDSPNGVLSAYRAGCKVIMVPDQTQPDKELCDLLYAKVDRLDDIIDYFERQNARIY